MSLNAEEILLDFRNDLSDVLGTQFFLEHDTLLGAKEELERVENRLQAILDNLDSLVKVVAVEKCHGHGECLHVEADTLNGLCPICGVLNTTVVYLSKDSN